MREKKKITTFKDLDAWKEGHVLVTNIYKVTNDFPKSEIFGLTNQLRRAVVSVTSNIAEGFSRQSHKEKIQFFSMSLGSLTEIQNQLQIALDVNYLDDETFTRLDKQTIVVSKLLNGLLKYLRTNNLA